MNAIFLLLGSLVLVLLKPRGSWRYAVKFPESENALAGWIDLVYTVFVKFCPRFVMRRVWGGGLSEGWVL